jgi:hypothetical protein
MVGRKDGTFTTEKQVRRVKNLSNAISSSTNF